MERQVPTCVACGQGPAMADCLAAWCHCCFFMCRGTTSMAMHDEMCSSWHAGGGGASGSEPDVGTGTPALTPVAELYERALCAAGCPGPHIVDFGHAKYLVFHGLEEDGRRSRARNLRGELAVCASAAPAIVRFVVHGADAVLACACAGLAHDDAALDMCVAEDEVAGLGPGAALAPHGAFASMLAAQVDLCEAVEVSAGACEHLCYARRALRSGDIPVEPALPAPGSALGMVVATGGGSWCAFKTATAPVSAQPLTIYSSRSGTYQCSCGPAGQRGTCQHVKDLVERSLGLTQVAAAPGLASTNATPDLALFRGPRASAQGAFRGQWAHTSLLPVDPAASCSAALLAQDAQQWPACVLCECPACGCDVACAAGCGQAPSRLGTVVLLSGVSPKGVHVCTCVGAPCPSCGAASAAGGRAHAFTTLCFVPQHVRARVVEPLTVC